MKVQVFSDLHLDVAPVKPISIVDGIDAVIVAGDVSTELSLLRRTLGFLAEVFHGGDEGADEDEDGEEEEERSAKKRMSNVFFCPGNNELRLARSDKKQNGTSDSLAKLADVLRVCEEVGVHTQPAKVNGQVWVVPLLAWYTPSFDPQWDGESHDYRRGWLDFRACAWPAELDGAVGGVAAHFLARNEEWMDSALLPFDAPVVSFSHFLPRFEVLPAGRARPDAGMLTHSFYCGCAVCVGGVCSCFPSGSSCSTRRYRWWWATSGWTYRSGGSGRKCTCLGTPTSTKTRSSTAFAMYRCISSILSYASASRTYDINI